MFEQTLIEPGGAGTRTASLAVSICGQVALVGAALMVPLVFHESLPLLRLAEQLVAPVPPAPRVVRIVDVQRAAAGVAPQTDGRRIWIPTAVPDVAQTIIDEVPPISGPYIAGNYNSADGPGRPDSVIGSILNMARHAEPAPPPKPVVQKVEPKQPQPITRIRQGGHVQEAMLLKRVLPVYPVLARQARIGGTVRLEGIIGRDGTVQQLRVVSGHPLLVKAALEAVSQWLYRPTMLNGDPVEVIAPIDVNFILN